ncbi:MAG: 2-C-methyl-D-erythritol 4-phosphate cytidylyltransferase [Selenomonadales bacterium]|nr:2-C-methyl-D-erythritol 4-phosphate cytidylyltransferase [Selenomonadales bacterium]
MITVIIAAAGRGSRMKRAENKVFLPLLEKPVLRYSIEMFAKRKDVAEIIVISAAHEVEEMETLTASCGCAVPVKVVIGGSERQYSVANALRAVDRDASLILVHDGARPLVTDEVIGAVIDSARKYRASIAAVPVKDTIKKVDADGMVVDTPPRKTLYAVQTPQGFDAQLLHEAYARAEADGFLGTDDASLVERLGIKVAIAEGDYQNIKITTPEDLTIGEALLKGRRICE